MLSKNHSENCFGFCRACGEIHSLPVGNAIEHAQKLIQNFETHQRLDFNIPVSAADSRLNFDQLFPGDRGHMFGVLECENEAGEVTVLRAFSSLAGGIRTVSGWVPSILEDAVFYDKVFPSQQEIKVMTSQLNEHEKGTREYDVRFQKRKAFSQNLMREIHDLYQITNFRGQSQPLREVFLMPDAIPGGVGDCCAPKLLNHAAQNGLKPLGVAEFYWGGENRSGRKQPGDFFPACEDKCQPILGFMLCGT